MRKSRIVRLQPTDACVVRTRAGETRLYLPEGLLPDHIMPEYALVTAAFAALATDPDFRIEVIKRFRQRAERDVLN